MALHVDYRFVVNLIKVSNLPEDAVVNDFHFRWQAVGAPGTSDFDAIRDALLDFYDNLATGQAATITSRLSRTVATGSHTVRAFNIVSAGTPTGPPDYEDVIAFGSVGTSQVNLPSELAACISMTATGYTTVAEHGAGGSRPRARYRSRVFIGPLNTSAMANNSSTTAVQRVASGFRDDLGDATVGLAAAADANGWRLSMYSRVDDVGRDINGGWVDDAFDVQRRRGEEASTRSLFVVP